MGIGFMRKALFVATFGLSGLVFQDNSKKKRTAKAAEKHVRPKKQTKVTQPTPRAARRPKPQAARRSTVAKTARAGNGTAKELERLATLHGRGALTGEEFAVAKAKILGTSLTSHAPGGDPATFQPSRDPATFQAVEANVAAARDLADLAVHDHGASVANVSSD